MTNEKESPNTCHLKLYTGVYRSPDERPPVIVWVTVDGDIFLSCGCVTSKPLRFVDDGLQCPECERVISREQAKREVFVVLGQIAALYGLFCVPTEIAVVETKETKQTD